MSPKNLLEMTMARKRNRLANDRSLPPRILAQVDAAALVSNYRAIAQLVPQQSLLPMLKANAYGHGAVWAGKALAGMAGLYGFGVATIEEGIQLREGLGLKARKVRILVFSGAAPWSEEKGQACEKHGLVPVLASDSDARAFFKQKWPERLKYELKFNSGMNRLGLHPGFIQELLKRLRALPVSQRPEGICTHLAMGEDPLNPQSRAQKDRFLALRRDLAGLLPAAQFHFGNSAAIWNHQAWGIDEFSDVVRPGLSLYGVPPWAGAPRRGIEPVLTLKASVVALQRLKKGDRIGYGGTYRVEESEAFIAVLGAGYADGIKRSLSNRGWAWLNGKPTRFTGIVSMDLCAVRGFASTRVGDWAELMGPQVDPWAQAQAADTIPYELLTSLSTPRVMHEV